jgi:hypothetical protein
MDTLTAVAFDLAPSALRPAGAGGVANTSVPTAFDVAGFDAVYAAAARITHQASPLPTVSASESNGLRAVIGGLQSLNGGAESLGASAQHMRAAGGDLRPSDLLNLTVKAHEFLFRCELTSSVANRSSDGIQQLFREQ